MPTKTKTPKRAPAKKKAPTKSKAAASRPLALNKLGYAIVFVTDMKKSVRFYSQTLGIPLRFPDDEWTELEMKGCTLALHRADRMPKNLDQAAIIELCFAADDVRGARARLIESGVKVSELHSVCEMGKNVGASASFRDPDGNHLGIFGMVPKAEWSGSSGCC